VSARRDVALLVTEHQLSEHQARRLLELDRSAYRYEARPDGNSQLREALLELARQKPRYGYRRLWAILERRGWKVKVKRIYRLYRAEGLMVRRLKRKRLKRQVPGRLPDRQAESGVGTRLRLRCAGKGAGAARAHYRGQLYAGMPGHRSRQRHLESAGDADSGQDH
jgi:hypothetical protein